LLCGLSWLVACGPSDPEDFEELFNNSPSEIARYVGTENRAVAVEGAFLSGNAPAVKFISENLLPIDVSQYDSLLFEEHCKVLTAVARYKFEHEQDLSPALTLLHRHCQADFDDLVSSVNQDVQESISSGSKEAAHRSLTFWAELAHADSSLGIGPHLLALTTRLDNSTVEDGSWKNDELPSSKGIVSWQTPSGELKGSKDTNEPNTLPSPLPSDSDLCPLLSMIASAVPAATLYSAREDAVALVDACLNTQRGPAALVAASELCAVVEPEDDVCGQILSTANSWQRAGEVRHDAAIRVYDSRRQLGTVQAELDTLEENVAKAKNADDAVYLQGVIVGQIEPQVYEVSRGWGDNVLLETTISEFSTTGRFGMWTRKMLPTEMVLTSGFTRMVETYMEHNVIAVGKSEIVARRADIKVIREEQKRARVSLGRLNRRYDLVSEAAMQSAKNHNLPPEQRIIPKQPNENQGVLLVTADYRYSVWVDGRHVGATPVELDVAPGNHKLRLVRKSGRSTSTINTDIDISAGGRTEIDFSD